MRASKTQGDNARNCTVRTFEHRTQVDLAAYAQGGEPQTADEIAIDRVFATNNDVSMGDTVALSGVEFHVVGIMTLADNQALFQSNSDFTVNTLSFGVAEVSSRDSRRSRIRVFCRAIPIHIASPTAIFPWPTVSISKKTW